MKARTDASAACDSKQHEVGCARRVAEVASTCAFGARRCARCCVRSAFVAKLDVADKQARARVLRAGARRGAKSRDQRCCKQKKEGAEGWSTARAEMLRMRKMLGYLAETSGVRALVAQQLVTQQRAAKAADSEARATLDCKGTCA
mmetsp:Transcript_3376/g.9295  ORF Transcript_3376/g.9295 Transcript_3376/m.9295 type:complete len:146 (-) Transcript_3376:159-596(-)